MIQLLFFLRFKTQLRRTRPALMAALEASIIETIQSAGGRVDNKLKIIVGSFDEHSLGIWLNLITVLEDIVLSLEKVTSELYGYALVIGRDIADYEMAPLCSALATRPGGTGIWCAPSVQAPLSPYAKIEGKILEPVSQNVPESGEGAQGVPGAESLEASLIKGYAQLQIIDTLQTDRTDPKNSNLFPFREKILRLICYGAHRNAVLLGPPFIGKRDGVYHFCAETLGAIPPLILRFGPRSSIGYFADLLSPKIRSFIGGYIPPETLEELNRLGGALFRERLMEEYSEYLIQKGELFFQKLLESYIATVKEQKGIAIIVLENIHNADDTALQICLSVFKDLADKTDVFVYGTCADKSASSGPNPRMNSHLIEKRLQAWKPLFPRIVKFTPEDYPVRKIPEMPRDLWEIAYSAYLLGRFFPGILFPQLFEEEEKKSAVLFRAFTILSDLGLIDNIEDPVPRIYNFPALARKMLGERKERIHQFVKNRLLAWIFSGKLRPCFNLLEILSSLGSQGADKLILEAVCGDVINGTYKEIERALKENRFNALVGETKAPALYYIFITLKALIHGSEAEILEAFKEPIPEGNFFSGYKIQILSNLTGYYLGIRHFDMASEVIKEAMIIGQGQKHGIAQAYRLFSLVNLVRQRVNDSIDYLSFAVDNAEKSEQFDELGVAAYYATVAQFLGGNLSKAEQLAVKAEQGAFAAGMPGWADRIRFFQGKLRFEIGYYQDALAIFSGLQQNPADTLTEEMRRVLSAWIYRAKVYGGSPPKEGPEFKGPDAFLFEVEASYMMGDYERTIALTQTIPGAFPETDFLYTERPDWRSGFAQCELLLIPAKDLWERMIFAYRGLAFCRLPSMEQERKQVISRMQRFIKDELLLDTDPNDIFYFYAYYRILQESGASEIDLNTAISMAFRRLQRRAIRIEDLETRRVFLNNHYWNSTLSGAAKEYKLI